MNITDYLVEYLKQGHPVSIRNVGTLKTREVDAFFDQETSTFHPGSRVVELASQEGDDSHFIKYLAVKECVEQHTAEQIWKNYTDALAAKLDIENQCQLDGLGYFVSDNGKVSFTVREGLNLKHPAKGMEPVAGVCTNATTTVNDPFARFEQPIRNEVVKVSALVHANEEEKISTPQIPDFPKPEPQHTEPDESDISDFFASMPQPETEPEPPVSPFDIEQQNTTEEQQHQENETPQDEQPDIVFDDNSHDNNNSDSENIDTLDQLDAIDGSESASSHSNNFDDEPERGRFWKVLLWVILAILLALGCTFAIDHYIFNGKGLNWVEQQLGIKSQPTVTDPTETETDETTTDLIDETEPSNEITSEVEPSETTEETEQETEEETTVEEEAAIESPSNITEFTFSLEGLQFSDTELGEERDGIMRFMNSWLMEYVKAARQEKNKEAFLTHVGEYIDSRLSTLTADNDFHPQYVLTYHDYVRENLMPYLKDRLLRRKAVIVQSELLSYDQLNNLMSQVVPADEFTPVTAQQRAANLKKAKKQVAKPAYVSGTSKKGFDILAGAFKNKDYANRMCNQLKSNGCDAYIVHRGEYYYVSMGSASSRTDAERLYNHIKEWYSGNISIKQW